MLVWGNLQSKRTMASNAMRPHSIGGRGAYAVKSRKHNLPLIPRLWGDNRTMFLPFLAYLVLLA